LALSLTRTVWVLPSIPSSVAETSPVVETSDTDVETSASAAWLRSISTGTSVSPSSTSTLNVTSWVAAPFPTVTFPAESPVIPVTAAAAGAAAKPTATMETTMIAAKKTALAFVR